MSVQSMGSASYLQSIAPQQADTWRFNTGAAYDRSGWPVTRDPILLNLDLLFPPSGRRGNDQLLPRLRWRMDAAVRQMRRTLRHTFHTSARHRGSERRVVGWVGAPRGDEASGASAVPLDGRALEQQISRLSQVIRSFEAAVAGLKAGGRALAGADGNGRRGRFAYGRAAATSRRSEEQDGVLREIFEANLALRQVEAHAHASEAEPKPFAQPVLAEAPSAIGNYVALSAAV